MNGSVPVNYVLNAFLNLQPQNNLRGEVLSLCMTNKFNRINLDTIYIYYIHIYKFVHINTGNDRP